MLAVVEPEPEPELPEPELPEPELPEPELPEPELPEPGLPEPELPEPELPEPELPEPELPEPELDDLEPRGRPDGETDRLDPWPARCELVALALAIADLLLIAGAVAAGLAIRGDALGGGL